MWAIVLLSALFYLSKNQARYSQDLGVAGSGSQQVLQLMPQVAPGGVLPDTEQIVLHASRGTLNDPPVRERIAALFAEVGTVPGVTAVADPFGPIGAAVLGVPAVSADGRTAVAPVIMAGLATSPDLDAVKRLSNTARAYGSPELQVEVVGPGASQAAAGGISPRPLVAALFVALVMLGLTLRSRVAVVVATVVAAGATLATVAVTSYLSHTVVMTPFAPLLAGVLAFGTSLGGSVVVVHRAQTALLAGRRPLDAAIEATMRSGLPVACGGQCLTLAMLGVVMLRLGGFKAVALGAAAAGAVTSLVVLTLLPALLAASGTRLLGWTERHHLTTTGGGLPRRPGARAWWARQVGRYPVVAAAAAGLVLLGVAAPVATLRLGGSDAGVDPVSASTRRGYDLISRDFFPGLNGPVVIMVDGGSGGRSVDVADVVASIVATPGVHNASPLLQNPDLGLTMIRVLPEYAPRSPEASDLVRRLRTEILPMALQMTVSKAYVGGQTALFDDMAAEFRAALPLFLAVLLVAVGLLTLLVLRSGTTAIVLAATGVLSALATAGALATAFQTDRFATRLDVETGPIEPFLLGFVLVAVFGLAPGMNLSLLGRLREGDGAGAAAAGGGGARSDGRDAVRRGHADVGHVVLTMNLIMIVAFVTIAAQPSRMMKLLGVGLAIGAALDAFVLRAAVLPALVHLRRREGVAASPATSGLPRPVATPVPGHVTAPTLLLAPRHSSRNRGRHSSRAPRPAAVVPASAGPGATRPAATRPAAARPVAAQSGAARPAATEPGTAGLVPDLVTATRAGDSAGDDRAGDDRAGDMVSVDASRSDRPLPPYVPTSGGTRHSWFQHSGVAAPGAALGAVPSGAASSRP